MPGLTPYKRASIRNTYTCRYLTYRLPNGRTILLPLLHVRLASEAESFSSVGLADSGATATFIPYEIANILDMIPNRDDRQEINVETAGGSCTFIPARIKKLSLISSENIISEFPNLPVLIPSPERDLPYVILGRDSIFKKFVITFLEKKHKFILKHHKYFKKEE